MKLKYTFIVNDVADQKVAVAVGEDMAKFNGFLKTNDIGAEILEILKEDVSLDEIVAKMMEKHPEATEQETRETVKEFTDSLIANNIAE